MKHCSRRVLLAAAASFGVSVAVPARAVLPVTDELGIIQWIKQTAQQAQQLQQQAQAYATQLRQYANMVQNTVALPYQVWNTVQGDIMQVRNLSNAASLLSGNSGSMVQRLSSAAGYASQAANIGNIAGQFTTWQQTIGNNVDTLGRTLGLQQGQQQTNAALIERMQAQSATATGQLQVLQAGNELAGATANQLIQIQATLAATAQLQAGNAAVAADRRASEDAALLGFARRQTVQGSGVTW
jgi:P-type conjugative transfer protein TrbJ